MTWLVNGKTIARKVKNRSHGVITSDNAGADDQEDDAGCERIIECSYCGNVLEKGNVRGNEHTYIHTCMHTYARTYVHTYIHM